MERSLSQEQVVDTAFRMIDEHGYEKFSMRSLRKRGMGTMASIPTFKSKRQLL